MLNPAASDFAISFAMKIHTINLSSAAELIAELDPNGRNAETWNDLWAWIFRGQSNSEYNLVPSALRKNTYLLHYRQWLRIEQLNRRNEGQQIRAEFDTFRRFFLRADMAGLPLPEDSMTTRATIAAVIRELNNKRAKRASFVEFPWPPDPLVPSLAVAQHHGIPTRLLDWTRNPWAGCYFAAVGAAKSLYEQSHQGMRSADDLPKRIAVFALARGNKKLADGLRFLSGRSTAVRTISVPAAGNPNLIAQEGLFTVVQRTNIDLDAPIDSRCLSESVSEPHPVVEEMENDGTLLRKYTVPAAEAPRLLQLVSRYGVSGAKLFPGFDGIKKCLDETRYWGLPEVGDSEEGDAPWIT